MAKENIITALQKLLEETFNRIDPKMDKAVIQKHIRDILSGVKITKENIDPELLAELMLTRTVQVAPTTSNVQRGEMQPVAISPDEPLLQKVVDDMLLGNNVWLHGAAGTGKTFIAKLAARIVWAMHGRNPKEEPFISVPCNQYTAPSVFLGGQTIDGYREGKLINCWVKGKTFILDEVTKLDPNTAGALNEALAAIDDPDPIISSNEIDKDGNPMQYRMHPDFCVIATSNTTGKGVSSMYGGNFQQDLSLLDRFSGNFYEVSFNDKRDRTLVSPVVFEFCIGVRKVFLSQKFEEIMTLRTMIHLDKVYNLEMKRLLMIGGLDKVQNGKTFEDSVNSLFSTMDKETQNAVKNLATFRILADADNQEEMSQADDKGYVTVNITKFLNSYRSARIYEKYLLSKTSRTPDEEQYIKSHGL